MTSAYAAFIAGKEHASSLDAGTPLALPDWLYGFQAELVDFAVRRRRAAIFADCGLGKTPMQLAWADIVVKRENKSVLILTPLAVGQQTIREATKFGIECQRLREGESPHKATIVIANYERLHWLDRDDFSGVVCDESSILKNFDGVRRQAITEFMRPLKYRLLCTATAAPNDYVELGTSSEAVGELGHMDMLNRFFVNDQHTSHPLRRNAHGLMAGAHWRFKGHSERAFWRWVCTWARSCRRPSDLGYPDEGFVLPNLIVRAHEITARRFAPGMLFATVARNMQEEREERRRTITERCEAVAQLIERNEPTIVWCHLNDEGDLLLKLIPEARQIAGSDSDDEKEELFEAFTNGQLRVLITKPKIGAWGLNWQHCARVISFATHSYEQYYQSVRRCWRYGQTRDVCVDVVMSEGEARVQENLLRKAAAADRMFAALVREMRSAQAIHVIDHATEMRRPIWA